MYEPVPEVDIPGLTRVGGTAEQASVSWGQAHSKHAAGLAPGTSLDGWASGTALTTADQGWTAFMSRLKEELHTFAAGLTQSAKDYQAADEAAAQRTGGAYGGRPR